MMCPGHRAAPSVFRRMQQLLEPRAEKEQRHIRISGLDVFASWEQF